ncbi:hypothetical protein P4O66_020192, partial [Electrophorus voltai]
SHNIFHILIVGVLTELQTLNESHDDGCLGASRDTTTITYVSLVLPEWGGPCQSPPSQKGDDVRHFVGNRDGCCLKATYVAEPLMAPVSENAPPLLSIDGSPACTIRAILDSRRQYLVAISHRLGGLWTQGEMLGPQKGCVGPFNAPELSYLSS